MKQGYVSDADDMLHDREEREPKDATRISDLNRSTIRRMRNVHACSVAWIARQLKLSEDEVESELKDDNQPRLMRR